MDNNIDSLKKFYEDIDLRTLSPLVLAHIGDAYFHLFVRVRLLKSVYKIQDLHEKSAYIVSALSQSKAYHNIESKLTDEERDIFRRGRNAKSRTPHNVTIAEYHTSTGFEALLGTLFLKSNFARLNEIADFAFDAVVNADREDNLS